MKGSDAMENDIVEPEDIQIVKHTTYVAIEVQEQLLHQILKTIYFIKYMTTQTVSHFAVYGIATPIGDTSKGRK